MSKFYDTDRVNRSRIEALKRTALFGGTDDSAIGFLVERATIVEIAAGDYFFRQGEAGRSAFLLEAGEVDVIKSWKGNQHRLRGLATGDCFGEVSLLDFGPRSASIRACSNCRAIEIRGPDLFALAEQNATQFALIYMNLGREVSRRLRAADERLLRADIDDVISRDH